MNNFTKKYSLSKTLRFELRPVGKTLSFIKERGLIKYDEDLAKKYKIAKKIIDDYHKDFIEKALSTFKFSDEDLNYFNKFYNDFKNSNNKDKVIKENYKKIQNNLRKELINHVKQNDLYKRMFGKELIQEDLIIWIKNKYKPEEQKEKCDLINSFSKFTTYFTGYNKNRENIYSAEAIPTSIAFRIVHENLPVFLDNINKYRTIKESFPEIDFSELEINYGNILKSKSLDDFFTLINFNNFLNKSNIDNFNLIRGGRSTETGDKIKGINEIINLYSQKLEHCLSISNSETEKLELKSSIRKIKSLKMKEFYKQILSDRDSFSFIEEKFNNDFDLLDSLFEFHDFLNSDNFEDYGIKCSLIQLTEKLFKVYFNESNFDNIYINNDIGLTNISNYIFGDYSFIKKSLFEYFKYINPPKKLNTPTEKEFKYWDDIVNKTKYFSVNEIESSINYYINDVNIEFKESNKNLSSNPIKDYVSNFLFNNEYINQKEGINLVKTINLLFTDIFELIESRFERQNKDLVKDKENTLKIKKILDNLMEVYKFLKIFYISNNKEEDFGKFFNKEDSFYNILDPVYENISSIISLYNKARNYLTQKPYSTEKYKLNFNNSTLLNGWDLSREKANSSVIFEKDGLFYLGIMQNNKIFENYFETEEPKSYYNKMIYKLLPNPNQMLPKKFFSKKNIKFYSPSDEILDNYKAEFHKKGDNFDLSKCHKLIDFFKASIIKNEDWKSFNFNFSKTQSYKDISDFYREVEQQGYKIDFIKIDEAYINKMIENGSLYLFNIYNKDFSPHSKGKPNLHTIYWKALFEKENLADVVYKLNGEAEIFYRKASLFYDEETWQKGHHYDLLKDKFTKNGKFIPIVKNKRYAEDKFMFHVPIKINFKNGRTYRFNDEVNQYLKNNRNINILSIDRGERHLAYYTLIDQHGVIKEQESLNIINNDYNNKKFQKNYHELLQKAEQGRDQARKKWDLIDKIKDLKSGYLSQVVNKLTQIVINNNAIVVFEDLNFGFKRGRFKIEKQVYQKLERMLIEKLNYLVIKDRAPKEPGGFLNAYQLTAPFTTFKDLGKQTGFIFYVPAYHTSKICPSTGFVNLLYPKYESLKQAKIFLNNFNYIKFNSQENYFEFNFNYNNFISNNDLNKTVWTICSYGKRLFNQLDKKNNIWLNKEIDLTNNLKLLFDKFNINFNIENDLKEQIHKIEDASFFKELMFLLKLILQIRNSKIGTDEDYLISPVKNKEGVFFDSRNADNTMPENADANGAYHIGLKGLMLLNKINKTDINSKLDLKITNKDWYSFVQNKD